MRPGERSRAHSRTDWSWCFTVPTFGETCWRTKACSHVVNVIRASLLPLDREGIMCSAPISRPPMEAPDLCWNVLYAFIFWLGVSVVLSLSIASFPMLVVVAAVLNVFMFVSSSSATGFPSCFPSDGQIQIMQDHVLKRYVKSPVQHLWTDLQVSIKGTNLKCQAHALSIKSQNPQSPTILLLHGTAASSTSFAECFDLLSQDFHVLALDLPGFGRSSTELDTTAKGRLSLAQMGTDFYVEFIDQFLNEQNLTAVILLGHSYGGFLSVHFAATRPQRITRLILLDAAGIFPTLGKLGCYWAVAFKFSLPQLLRYFLSPAGAWVCLTFFWAFGHDDETRYWFAVTQHPLGWGDRCIANAISLSWFEAYWKNPAISMLLNLPCPVLTVYGEEDNIMPIHQGRALEGLSGIPCVSVPKAGHSPFHDSEALILSEVVRDGSLSCNRPKRTALNGIPLVQWQTFKSTFSTTYTSKVIESLYDGCVVKEDERAREGSLHVQRDASRQEVDFEGYRSI